jgi:hypothetical protein
MSGLGLDDGLLDMASLHGHAGMSRRDTNVDVTRHNGISVASYDGAVAGCSLGCCEGEGSHEEDVGELHLESCEEWL